MNRATQSTPDPKFILYSLPSRIKFNFARLAGLGPPIYAHVLVFNATVTARHLLMCSGGPLAAFVPVADSWLVNLEEPRLGPVWEQSRREGVPSLKAGRMLRTGICLNPLPPTDALEMLGGPQTRQRAQVRTVELLSAWERAGTTLQSPLWIAWPLHALQDDGWSLCAITRRLYRLNANGLRPTSH